MKISSLLSIFLFILLAIVLEGVCAFTFQWIFGCCGCSLNILYLCFILLKVLLRHIFHFYVFCSFYFSRTFLKHFQFFIYLSDCTLYRAVIFYIVFCIAIVYFMSIIMKAFLRRFSIFHYLFVCFYFTLSYFILFFVF